MRKGLSFGEALERLKKGALVAREGWDGKGMYLKYYEGRPVDRHLNPMLKGEGFEDLLGDSIQKNGQMLPHIVMKVAGDSKTHGKNFSDYVPWLASQTDILANDWRIIPYYRSELDDKPLTPKKKGPRTFPFKSGFDYGEIVKFCPAGSEEYTAVVVGVTMKGPKISFHLILESGACLKTYGERVKPYPKDCPLPESTVEWAKEISRDQQAEL